jgi:hypothetical protein
MQSLYLPATLLDINTRTAAISDQDFQHGILMGIFVYLQFDGATKQNLKILEYYFPLYSGNRKERLKTMDI